jgi:hypothetical protein
LVPEPPVAREAPVLPESASSQEEDDSDIENKTLPLVRRRNAFAQKNNWVIRDQALKASGTGGSSSSTAKPKRSESDEGSGRSASPARSKASSGDDGVGGGEAKAEGGILETLFCQSMVKTDTQLREELGDRGDPEALRNRGANLTVNYEYRVLERVFRRIIDAVRNGDIDVVPTAEWEKLDGTPDDLLVSGKTGGAELFRQTRGWCLLMEFLRFAEHPGLTHL